MDEEKSKSKRIQFLGKPKNGQNGSLNTSIRSDIGGNENEPPSTNNFDVFQEREGPGGMRVGKDFQAKIPPMIPKEVSGINSESEKALLVWCPSEKVSETEVERYMDIARERYQYSGEQALGLLFWHQYDVQKSFQDLVNFSPQPEEWTIEDKVLFEQAFQFHGKAFDRIRSMKQNGEAEKSCENCGCPISLIANNDQKENLCKTCFIYKKRSGENRPLTRTLTRGERQILGSGILRQRQYPPKGMYLNYDDLELLAKAPPQAENVTLHSLQKEIHDLKCVVQTSKQEIEILKRNLPDEEEGIDKYRPTPASTFTTNYKPNARWSNEELLLAAQGVRRYGKNFQKIAEILGTKTESHLKSFFVNYRKRYELDKLIADYQKDVEEGLIFP